jgi:hypothetical protein
MYRYFASEVYYRALEKINVRTNAIAWDHLISLLNKCYRVIYDQLTSVSKDKPYSEVIEVSDLSPTDTPNLYSLPVPEKAREFVLYSAPSINGPRTTLNHSTSRWERETGTYYTIGDTIYVYPYPAQRLFIEYVKQPQTITLPAAPVKLDNFPFEVADFMDDDYVYSGVSKMFLKPPYTVSNTQPHIPFYRYDRYTLYPAKDTGIFTKIEAQLDGETSRIDISDYWIKQDYNLVSFIADEPLIFVSYKYKYGRQETYSYIADRLDDPYMDRYNIFDYTGRETTGQILGGTHDDTSGYGVIFKRENRGNIEFYYSGWTPDTYLNFPSQLSYEYYICLLAAELLFDYGGNDPAIDRQLMEARKEFTDTVSKDRTSFQKLDKAGYSPRPGVYTTGIHDYGR